MKIKFIIILSIILLTSLSCQKESSQMNENKFTINRGLNVSHWLSQTTIRGSERAAYVTEKDFKLIAELGFDHVRLPIDEEHFWSEDGKRMDDAFESLNNAVNWSIKNNLKIIVDLHVLRSHHFNSPDSKKLWEEDKAQNDFINFWKQLSGELKKYPNSMVAYEPLNEAVADNPEDWNKLINWVIAEIRKLEPNRTIIMGSNMWQQTQTFKDLRVPEKDENIILSFHYYRPMPVTHFTAPWTEFGDYDGPSNYPGWSIDSTLINNYEGQTREALNRYNEYFDKEVIEKDIMQAVSVANKFNLKLYCGEYGCFPTTPIEIRQAWYKDMHEIFEKYNIAWAHWNYKNDFPVVDENLLPINELLDIMVPKK